MLRVVLWENLMMPSHIRFDGVRGNGNIFTEGAGQANEQSSANPLNAHPWCLVSTYCQRRPNNQANYAGNQPKTQHHGARFHLESREWYYG
jgi:hypothetical protein